MESYDVLAEVASKALEIPKELVSLEVIEDHTYTFMYQPVKWSSTGYVNDGSPVPEKRKKYALIVYRRETKHKDLPKTTVFKSLPMDDTRFDRISSNTAANIIDQMYRNAGSPVI